MRDMPRLQKVQTKVCKLARLAVVYENLSVRILLFPLSSNVYSYLNSTNNQLIAADNELLAGISVALEARDAERRGISIPPPPYTPPEASSTDLCRLWSYTISSAWKSWLDLQCTLIGRSIRGGGKYIGSMQWTPVFMHRAWYSSLLFRNSFLNGSMSYALPQVVGEDDDSCADVWRKIYQLWKNIGQTRIAFLMW
jgi:hypothetical protein